MRFSDDHEPQGTAGMPTLDAIRKNGVTDAAVITIRYFGGTLLGTGGLVRAYSAAAVGAIEKARIITYDIYTQIKIIAGYSDYQKLLGLISTTEFRIKDTAFADSVILSGSIKKELSEDFIKKIKDATSARVNIDILDDVFEY
jgi:putative IMPACT (imprinted ancient) family translation regulator